MMAGVILSITVILGFPLALGAWQFSQSMGPADWVNGRLTGFPEKGKLTGYHSEPQMM